MPLGEALAGARAADRTTRIDRRDRIAQHGAAAIEAVSPWVTALGIDLVRVLEKVERGEVPEVQALTGIGAATGTVEAAP